MAVRYPYGSTLHKLLGQPSTVTNAKGTQTAYTLDKLGRITDVALADLAQLEYDYHGGMLNALTRTAGNSSQSYGFLYDVFGNTEQIGIIGTDGIDLASYTYGPKNGLLTRQTAMTLPFPLPTMP